VIAQPAPPPARSWRGTLLLLAGALGGVAMAAGGIVSRAPAAAVVPDGAVAVVNGAPIQRVDYQRALAAVAAGRRGGTVDESLRRHVLERLIDEELLVQRGLELGLAERDPMARTYLSAAVIDLVVARADDEPPPDDAALRRFYAEHAGYFQRAGRLSVEQAFFRAGAGGAAAARARAEEAARQLAGGADFTRVAALGDPPAALLPAAPIAPGKLRDYLGPTVTAAVERLAPGEVSPVLTSSDGYHLVRLVAREPPRVPPFEAVREQALAEYRRREGDRRVQRLLAERRARAAIAVDEGAL
jgi:parvulin-like peptidyl-prolyl isomerase